MFRKVAFLVAPLLVFILVSFTPDKAERWTAVIELEGTKKPIVLVSEAIYGGYNSFGKKYFFFGKNGMFRSKTEPEMAKIFSDFCITNSSGQFQFEILKIDNPNQTKTSSANISFKKKFSTTASLVSGDKSGRSISVSGDFKQYGLQLTEEAAKVMTGRFKLTIKSQN